MGNCNNELELDVFRHDTNIHRYISIMLEKKMVSLNFLLYRLNNSPVNTEGFEKENSITGEISTLRRNNI